MNALGNAMDMFLHDVFGTILAHVLGEGFHANFVFNSGKESRAGFI
jgi:hypothetical protein